MPSDLRATGRKLLHRQRLNPGSEENTQEMYSAFTLFFPSLQTEAAVKTFSHLPHTVSQGGQVTPVFLLFLLLFCFEAVEPHGTMSKC